MSICMGCRYWHYLPGVANYEQGNGECHLLAEPRPRRGYAPKCGGYEVEPFEEIEEMEGEA